MAERAAVRERHKSGREIVFLRLNDLTDLQQGQLVLYAIGVLDKNGPLQRQLGEEKIGLFKRAIEVLLSGRSLYVDELERLGLGTERILKQTGSLMRSYRIHQSRMRDQGPSERGFSVRGGTDLFEFLGDNSGRGSIQGDPWERD